MGKGGNSGKPVPIRAEESECKVVEEKQYDAKLKGGFQLPSSRLDDFMWEYTEEPHATRRQQILAKHPEIKKLFGYCPRTKYVIAFCVTVQTYLAYQFQFLNWWQALLVTYVIGGSCNHWMMMAMHELSHNLGFKKILHNRIASLVANLPVGVPSAISFKRYHSEHHRYQGEDGIDVDLPTPLEGRFFQTSFRKSLFVIFQVFFYAIRPLCVNPKTPGKWEFFNLLACLSYDAAIYYFCGLSGVVYLLLSTFLGAGIHPVAGHFIAEHYVFVEGYETYSYYGILNWVTFNVGYHNEHHDFPYVPGTRLPLVRAIAPEFYENLPKTDSWITVLYNFVMNPYISSYNRVKRDTLSPEVKARLRND